MSVPKPHKVHYNSEGQPQLDPQLTHLKPTMNCVYKESALGGAACIEETTGNGFHLWVGDVNASRDMKGLKSLGITTIINCCCASVGQCPRDWMPFPNDFTYCLVWSNDFFYEGSANEWDINSQDPSSQWTASNLMLRECMKKKGGALIHCHFGINRSATTAAVFLATSGLAADFDAALKLCKEARPCVEPLPEYIEWGRRFCEVEGRKSS